MEKGRRKKKKKLLLAGWLAGERRRDEWQNDEESVKMTDLIPESSAQEPLPLYYRARAYIAVLRVLVLKPRRTDLSLSKETFWSTKAAWGSREKCAPYRIQK